MYNYMNDISYYLFRHYNANENLKPLLSVANAICRVHGVPRDTHGFFKYISSKTDDELLMIRNVPIAKLRILRGAQKTYYQINALNTRREAAYIIDLFDEVLDQNDITINSPEDDDRDWYTSAPLYGSVYDNLLRDVEERLINIIERAQNGDRVVKYTFTEEAITDESDED